MKKYIIKFIIISILIFISGFINEYLKSNNIDKAYYIGFITGWSVCGITFMEDIFK